ncbi:MAG TPA: hypothetical protein VF444_09650 [Pseudonocardiaceae bacterium]
MAETKELDAARERFAEHVRAKYAALAGERPSSTKANRQVAATDSLVQEWDERGIVKDVLVPLLDDQDPALRCSAASYLLYHGESERAQEVLTALADEDDLGAVASLADTALLVWEDRHDDGRTS